ncbi:MAG: nucleotidyltransferase family protein [Gemmatimonadota bacterium]
MRRPDVDFVLAALRGDAGAAHAQRAAAARVDDWAAVARYTAAHDVAWWVRRALPAEGVPGDVVAILVDAVREAALHALAAARQLADVSRALGDAGVRAVAYKGPALSIDVHADLAARKFDDLDILVGESDRQRACAALAATGYASPSGFSEREEKFYSRWEGVAHFSRDGALPVELHWRCQAPRYGGPQDPADIVARARPCALGGGTVLVPSPEDLGVLLALHGVKHAWRYLQWVADFSAAVSRPAFEWSRFVSLADGWRVRRAMHCSVLVAHDLVALDVPSALLRAARDDVRAEVLARGVVTRLTLAGDAPEIGAESTARYDLQWLDGPLAKARYLALAAALPTPQERNVARLPDALLPLAYPLRAWRLLQHARGRRA